MKFTVTLKDPDGADESIEEASKASVGEVVGIDDDERSALQEHRANDFREFASKWMRYGEYITVEFDTVAGTATVLKTT